MKNEKHIHKIKLKKGYALAVSFKVDGKVHRFGYFNRSDYDSDRSVMDAAEACRDKALVDRRQNQLIIHDMTVNEAYEKSLELFVTNIKTKERHNVIYRQMVPDTMQNKAISKLTAADIQKAINKFAETHSADALSRTLSIWKQIYRAALMSGCPAVDQSQLIIMPKAKKPQGKHAKHCTVAELEEFLEGLEEYNAYLPEGQKLSRDATLAIRVMQYLGLRPQEAFALCAEDIDLKKGLVCVRRSVGSTATEKRQLIATKTNDSARVLPIPDQLRPYLEEMLTHDTRPLLADLDGLPYDTSKISVLMCNVAKSKNVPHINLYMLRHMFGTDISKKDIKLAQTMMGHESAKMTLGYAKESSIDAMRAVLKKRYS